MLLQSLSSESEGASSESEESEESEESAKFNVLLDRFDLLGVTVSEDQARRLRAVVVSGDANTVFFRKSSTSTHG